MTMELVAPFPKLRFVDNNGQALSGGKIFVYTAGTTTKATTFTDSTGNTANTNPVILDTRGECNIWIPPNTNLKFVLSPSTDSDPPTNPIWTVDNVSASIGVTSIIPCTAVGTNTITLTPVSGTVNSYSDQQLFSFYAAANSTGAVTINAGPGARNAYLPGGTQQAGADTFINGQFYVVAFNANLNSNAGGFLKIGQDATNGTFATLASAATCNIGSANAEYLQITGTTTITAFDTALAGIVRELEFAGSLTLTHNATSLIMPGGVSLVTQAGDVARFRSEGAGNWRCVGYQAGGASAATAPGFKNAIQNGGCDVAQRSAPNLSTSFQYGAVDRFLVAATAGTVSAGTIAQSTSASVGRTGKALQASGVTTTAGACTISAKQRIESVDAVKLKNQTGSFSVRVYQDTGSAINYQVTIRKPTAADNYASTTQIAQSGLISVASATDTPITFAGQALGDCSAGLEIQVDAIVGAAVTTKNFYFTEWQMEQGTSTNAFERRPYAQELRDCQRFAEVISDALTISYAYPFSTSSGATSPLVSFMQKKRATPTLSLNGTASLGAGGVGSSPALSTAFQEAFCFTATGSSVGYITITLTPGSGGILASADL